jgi:hypothetical protein
MKTIIAIAILLSVFTSTAFSSNYEEVMKTNVEKIFKSSESTQLVNLANQFQRISNAEEGEWLPNYYAAYCYVSATFYGKMSSDEIHQHLDLAQAEIEKALKIDSKESEIYALQAFIYQIRITDMSKGYKYSKLANEALVTAQKLDAENPRVYYLSGSNTFHTPKMFGGGKEKAKPFFVKAAELFETSKPKSEISPSWGAEHNKQLLAACNEEE